MAKRSAKVAAKAMRPQWVQVAWLPRDYDPARFDPASVTFSNPLTRLRAMQRA